MLTRKGTLLMSQKLAQSFFKNSRISGSPINQKPQFETTMKQSFAIAAVFLIAILVLTISLTALYLNNQSVPTPGRKPTASPASSSSPAPSASILPTPLEVQHYTYTIVNTYPHNSSAFTEGLVYDNGNLYESTGAYPSNIISTLRHIDLVSGNVINEISTQDFGEGITIVNNRIIQLTWQSHIGFLYDKTSLEIIGNFSYPTEGWGLTYNGTTLIMSDGTNHLYFLDPTTFQQVGEVAVHEGNKPISNLNELEYINGSVYANIFMNRTIVIINPETGQVTGGVDLSGLQGASGNDPNFVLNGIAYDASGNRLFVTGKDWPHLYEINLVPVSS